jgi:hypothetical protein
MEPFKNASLHALPTLIPLSLEKKSRGVLIGMTPQSGGIMFSGFG